MSRPASVIALALTAALCGSASVCHAGMQLVTFDELEFNSSTTFVDRHTYGDLGLRFNRDIPIGRVEELDPDRYDRFLDLGGTPKNGVTLKSGLGYTIDAGFFVPGTMIAATTDWVSVLFYDTNIGTTLGRLDVYGLDGSLLASITQTTQVEMGMVFSVGLPGIHRIRLSVDGDGGVADNIAFLSVPEVPAPGTLVLLSGAGMIGLGRRRRAE